MSEKSKSFFKKLIRPSGIITIIIIILAISLVASSAFVVDESEQAVITRFGAYNKTLGPGLHIKMPFGIDKKYIVIENTIIQQIFPQGFNAVEAKEKPHLEFYSIILDQTLQNQELNFNVTGSKNSYYSIK